jgi:hypothetical protein
MAARANRLVEGEAVQVVDPPHLLLLAIYQQQVFHRKLLVRR